METKYYNATNNSELNGDLRALLDLYDLKIGGKCQIFDGKSWMKKGDVDNNECYYVDATIWRIGIRDYNDVVVDVRMSDGNLSGGHFIEGVRKCCA